MGRRVVGAYKDLIKTFLSPSGLLLGGIFYDPSPKVILVFQTCSKKIKIVKVDFLTLGFKIEHFGGQIRIRHVPICI